MNTEQQYIQAFNNGYILAQHGSKILNTLTKSLTPSNNYLEGFFAGKEEFELERNKHQLFELGKLRSQSHTNNKDRAMD